MKGNLNSTSALNSPAGKRLSKKTDVKKPPNNHHKRANKENNPQNSNKSEITSFNSTKRIEAFVPGKIFNQTNSEAEIKKTKLNSSLEAIDSQGSKHLLNIISGLRKELDEKEIQLLRLKDEIINSELSCEERIKELSMQIKEQEKLRSRINDHTGLCAHCITILKPYVSLSMKNFSWEEAALELKNCLI
jgi:hypothetical protein